MRLLVYNIRYATGTGPSFHLPVPGAGYLRSNRKVLAGITDFIRAESQDVVGLIEVDTGSIRTGMVNQAEPGRTTPVWNGVSLAFSCDRLVFSPTNTNTLPKEGTPS